jgi:putative ABC transport system permease protein
VLVGFIAGIYPAYILSALKPALIIKGNYGSSTSGKGIIRNVLVLFQYGISIIFIMGTLIINGQLNYMHNKDLGYDKEQVLKLSGRPARLSSGRDRAFKQDLLRINGVKGVSAAGNIFGSPQMVWNNLRILGSELPDEATIFRVGYADINILENFQIKITSDKTLSTSGRGYFLTESALKELKLTDPVGEYLIRSWPYTFGEWKADLDTIIISGVIQDFHYNSAQNQIEPVALVLLNEHDSNFPMRYYYIKITGSNIQQTVADIETAWKDLAPGSPFVYSFLDLEIDKFYAEEQKMSELIGLFSLLAILISCLGILGLSAYLAQQKNKEISIRKILGASLNHIVSLLVKKHATLIIAAILIFIPIAYFFSHKWLSNYPYRISIDALTILTTIAAIIVITGISISWQLFRGVHVNPLEAIKSE